MYHDLKGIDGIPPQDKLRLNKLFMFRKIAKLGPSGISSMLSLDPTLFAVLLKPIRRITGNSDIPLDASHMPTGQTPLTSSGVAHSLPFSNDLDLKCENNKKKKIHWQDRQCWEHGCNGRTFSQRYHLLRHMREKDAEEK